MSLEVVKGAPLPFAFDILTTSFMYGNRVFVKYPPNIPDYFKQAFPDGYHWERIIPFEDQGMCTVTSHIRLASCKSAEFPLDEFSLFCYGLTFFVKL